MLSVMYRASKIFKNPEEVLVDAVRDGHLVTVQSCLKDYKKHRQKHSMSSVRRLLGLAAKYGHAEILKYLLDAGMDLYMDFSQDDGKTALYHAAENGHLSVVKELLKHGVNPNVYYRYPDKIFPIDVAAHNGHHEIVAYLQKEESHRRAFFDASLDGNLAVIQAFLKTHTAKAIDRMFSIAQCSSGGLCLGVNNNIDSVTKCGVLSIAASRGHLSIVQALIAAGVTINQQDKTGKTALYWAAYYAHLPVVKALIQRGAYPDQDVLEAVYFAKYRPAQPKNSHIVKFFDEQEQSCIHKPVFRP